MVGSGTPRSYAEWVRTEGGIEHPTHIETLKKAEQVARIGWLKRQCNGMTNILDLGCNWGYILNELNGKTGMDINPENIDLAMKTFPKKHWMVGDITKDLEQFGRDSYAIVILAEVLEHIDKEEVGNVIMESVRIARRKILFTLPKLQTEDYARCFKHRWIPDLDNISRIIALTLFQPVRIVAEMDDYFIYMEILK